jgi:trehalose 6-phosphate synthase
LSRLVVISNRVAVPGDAGARAGGLAVALRPVVKRHPGIWFGWSGQISRSPGSRVRMLRHGNQVYALTHLAKEDYEEYYAGFANRVLWPVFHYRLDMADFSHRDLGGYFRVNEQFADELHDILLPDDVIWVHDYHLIPLGSMLRTLGHRNRIGYFHHIPFPSVEMLTALPKHDRIIPTLTDYDLVGFQTECDADNFARYLRQERGAGKTAKGEYQVQGRSVRIGIFPAAVEMAALQRLARRSTQSTFVREVLGSLGNRAMMIGVDRLDYSKGIPMRMEAFDRFLTADPSWRGKVTYLQITPKSRCDVKEYADLARQVDEIAGRINGRYGEAAWTPIRYVNRTHSRSALAGLYRSARVALITPLRDGMNLVAKEYVACQDPNDPGVLILSRFAGSSAECKAALLVNPYDPESVAEAIGRALSMPRDERRSRHEALYSVLAARDVRQWGERFLEKLQGGSAVPERVGRSLRPPSFWPWLNYSDSPPVAHTNGAETPQVNPN